MILVTINTGHAVHVLGLRGGSAHVKVVDSNEFFVTVIGDGWNKSRAIPMNSVDIRYDETYQCMELLEKNP